MPEHTIAENLQRLIDAKAAIGSAIAAKGGTVGANDGLEEFASDIATIPSGGGGGSQPRKDVNFYDYDGTIVNSYTASEFANLTAMPDNPSHDGLTAQGWNWILANAKSYVSTYGKLDIGQMYASDTPNGNTLIHIKLSEGRLKPFLGLKSSSGATTIDINWGDNSPTETVVLSTTTTYTPHNYSNSGEYVISISVIDGSFSLDGDNVAGSSLLRASSSPVSNNDKVYQNALMEIELGDNVASINAYAFRYCYSLSSVKLSVSITTIGPLAFADCYSLKTIIIAKSPVNTIQNNAFENCSSLTSIIIPDSIVSIGDYAFRYCYSLKKIVLPKRPTIGTNELGTALFSNCFSLTTVTIPNSYSTLKGNLFSGCKSLTSITIPSSVTSIQKNICETCYSLSSISIPNSVTSIQNNAFSSCYSLSSITIPSNVSSIGNYAFQSCYGMGTIRFERTTPPSVQSGTWSNIPTDCIILAPALVVNLYMNGTNYPSKATYTYIGYATYESGATLPDKTTDETHTLTWYATQADAIAQTNPITTGTGNEVYAIATAI